jgi:hypothetical protein
MGSDWAQNQEQLLARASSNLLDWTEFRTASQLSSTEDVSTEAEEPPLLAAITWQRLVKT